MKLTTHKALRGLFATAELLAGADLRGGAGAGFWSRPTVTVGLLLKTVLYCGDAIASYKQVTATHQSLSLALQARLAKTTLTRLK